MLPTWLLTAARDYRDKFAVEILGAVGAGDAKHLATSEIPVAFAVLLPLAAIMLIQSHRLAVIVLHGCLAFGFVLAGASTYLFQQELVSGFLWYILVGTGLYLAYVPFHSILFERLVALMRRPANAGYLIYIADATGYLSSVAILLWKNFAANVLPPLDFFHQHDVFHRRDRHAVGRGIPAVIHRESAGRPSPGWFGDSIGGGRLDGSQLRGYNNALSDQTIPPLTPPPTLKHPTFPALLLLAFLMLFSATGCRRAAEAPTRANDPPTQTDQETPAPPPAEAEIVTGEWSEVGDAYEADGEVEQMILPYRQKLQAVMQEEIGVAEAALVRQLPESPLGGFVADVILRHARSEIDADAICALMNRGGIRLPELPAGPITVADVYQLVPFDNLVVVVTLTGDQLEALIQTLAAGQGEAYSGIVYQLERRPADGDGERWIATNIQVGGAALDSKATYKLATVDYLANIGGEFAVLQEASYRQDGQLFLRDVMIEDLRQQKTIRPVIDGRVTYANATNE